MLNTVTTLHFHLKPQTFLWTCIILLDWPSTCCKSQRSWLKTRYSLPTYQFNIQYKGWISFLCLIAYCQRFNLLKNDTSHLFIHLLLHLKLWNKLVPVITYVIGAINSHSLTSLSFFSLLKLIRWENITMLPRNWGGGGPQNNLCWYCRLLLKKRNKKKCWHCRLLPQLFSKYLLRENFVMVLMICYSFLNNNTIVKCFFFMNYVSFTFMVFGRRSYPEVKGHDIKFFSHLYN